MTRIEDFSESVRDLVDDLIGRHFEDAIPVLEAWFPGGLTTGRLIFFEQYWRANGPFQTPARAFLEALRRAREPSSEVRPRGIRREVVVIKGHQVVVYRSLVTGRFVRRRRRL